jgi:transcriptional regulator with PAS, ATPase and Fis domain
MVDNNQIIIEKGFNKFKIIFKSVAMKEVINQADIAAKNDVTTFINGESGVGKELIAQYIHNNSSRVNGPFITVNCSAVPETLFEGLFFGHEKGSFTSAINTQKGYFEQANNGTIFLDEITEIPFDMQAKLLRVIEDKYIIRIGGDKKIPIDVRILSASNKSPQSLIQEGKFRLDLYYRLVIWIIRIPPLRERKEDIKALTSYFLEKYCGNTKSMDLNAMDNFINYDWPGNIRELETCILRAILSTPETRVITEEDLQFDMMFDSKNKSEYKRIINAFNEANGNIKKATEILGCHRSTFYNRLKTFGISVTDFRTVNNGGYK